MKLPRWLVAVLMTSSVLAILAAVGYWWVAWPEGTAREFVAHVIDSHFDQANELLEGIIWLEQTDDTGRLRIHLKKDYWSISSPPGFWESDFQNAAFGPRTLSDVLQGRLQFRVTTTGMVHELNFVVTGGKVHYVGVDEH